MGEHDFIRKRELFAQMSRVMVDAHRSAKQHDRKRVIYWRWTLALGLPGNVVSVVLASSGAAAAALNETALAVSFTAGAALLTAIREVVGAPQLERTHGERMASYQALQEQAQVVRDTRIRHYTETPLDELVFTCSTVISRLEGLDASDYALLRDPWSQSDYELHPLWREVDF